MNKFDSAFFYNDPFFTDDFIVNGKPLKGIVNAETDNLQTTGNLGQKTAHFITVSFLKTDIEELVEYNNKDVFVFNGVEYKYSNFTDKGDTVEFLIFNDLRRKKA